MIRTLQIRQNLIAALETALFLKTGTQRFTACSKAMRGSFLIPTLLLPMTLLTVFYAHPGGALTHDATQILAAIYTLRLFVYLTVFLGVVYLMAKNLNNMQSFTRFATANNWLTLPAALMMLPLLALFLSGHYSWAEIYPMMVLITLYAYAYTGFMAMHVLRIPMELAGFVAIAGMAIHQTSLDILKWAAIHTLNWIA